MGFWSKVRAAFLRAERSGETESPSLALGPGNPDTSPSTTRSRRLAGVSSRRVLHFSQLQTLEHNTKLVGDKWYGRPGIIGEAQKMMRDGTVQSAYGYRTNPVRCGLWEVVPGGTRPIDIECAAFVQWNLMELLNWDGILQKLNLAHRDGASLLERTDDVVDVSRDRFPLHPGRGKGVVITGLKHIPLWTVERWHQDEKHPDRCAAIEQFTTIDGVVSGSQRLDSTDFLRFTINGEGSNFTGQATLRACWGAWFRKILLCKIELVGHDRWSSGIPYGKMPKGHSPDDRREFETSLAELRSNERAYLATEQEYDVELLQTDGKASSALSQSKIETIQEIHGAVQATFASLGDAKFGSYALGGLQGDHFGLAVEGDGHNIEAIMTHGADGWSPIGRLHKLNYPKAARPHLRVRNLPTRNTVKELEALDKHIENGLIKKTPDIAVAVLEKLRLPTGGQEGSREDVRLEAAA